MNKEEILEDAVVTTTNNGGAGLDSPQLPIKPKNSLFRRTSTLIKKKCERDGSNTCK